MKNEFKFVHHSDIDHVYTANKISDGTFKITWKFDHHEEYTTYEEKEVERYLRSGIWIEVEDEDTKENEITTEQLEKLKQRITAHQHATMDAPYFGWKREFIDGYELALKRVLDDVKEIFGE